MKETHEVCGKKYDLAMRNLEVTMKYGSKENVERALNLAIKIDFETEKRR